MMYQLHSDETKTEMDFARSWTH